MTRKWASEFVAPRGPRELLPLGEPAPDFELPSAQYVVNADGQEQVRYGETLRLSSLRGQPVVLELTRIVSDRFF
jgi:peroxiredoxin